MAKKKRKSTKRRLTEKQKVNLRKGARALVKKGGRWAKAGRAALKKLSKGK